jgi:hypothetical protein
LWDPIAKIGISHAPEAEATEQKGADLQALRVSDRTRTGDRLDHNQELYQLSYAHRADPM